MEVTVEFLSLPNVTRLIGARSVKLGFPGGTLEQLVETLTRRHGPKVRDFLLDEEGRLDMVFRVVVNDSEWLTREELDRPVFEGDRVAIAMLVGGG